MATANPLRADGPTADDSFLIGEECPLVRIEKVSIENYRCLQSLDLEIDDLTVLIGANSTGKSSVLRALRWFFDGGDLEPEDVCGMKDEATVSVTVTFGDLTPKDRGALAPYGERDSATFRRTWSAKDGGKLTGRAMAYPPFEEVRNHEKAADLKKAYGQLRKDSPGMGLPSSSRPPLRPRTCSAPWGSPSSVDASTTCSFPPSRMPRSRPATPAVRLCIRWSPAPWRSARGWRSA